MNIASSPQIKYNKTAKIAKIRGRHMKKTTEIKQDISKGFLDERLIDIYVDQEKLACQKERYLAAIERFEELYGQREVEIYSAPGRSEVGGNHTDHQHGQVLAAGLNIDVIAIVAKTDDGIMKIVSDHRDIPPVDTHELEKKTDEEGSSKALIRGVAAKLSAEGYRVGGFLAYMTSEVLTGSGMSSSAAFEVVVGTVLSGLYNDMHISPVVIAQAGQYAENVYFGKPCGLMDQMASSVGSLVNIDFKDPAEPMIQKVDVDFSSFKHALCITDTKGDHENLTPEYAAIPAELKEVCRYFGCEYLRDVQEDRFYEELPSVRKAAGDRAVLRAIHVYEDHKRVGLQVEALREGRFDDFKELIIESGRSSFQYLQNVYPNSDVQNQSVSIALALSEKLLKGKGAWRVHGGGFAGTIQAFVPDELVETYRKEMDRIFGEGSCHVMKVRKYGGMKVL